jgi:hypothetical protein
MTCPNCGGEIVIANNIYGKAVTYHQVPSLTEGYYTHTEVSC